VEKINGDSSVEGCEMTERNTLHWAGEFFVAAELA
jgi:hypothetical protein